MEVQEETLNPFLYNFLFMLSETRINTLYTRGKREAVVKLAGEISHFVNVEECRPIRVECLVGMYECETYLHEELEFEIHPDIVKDAVMLACNNTYRALKLMVKNGDEFVAPFYHD